MNLKQIWNDFIHGKEGKKETEFLPAILEVTETPPSPTGRVMMWSILIIIVVAFLWSVFGHINEVAVATGKVIPTGQVKTVQVKNKGIVKEIYVEEGDHVEQGQKLLVLDPTSTDADVTSLESRVAYYELDIARLNAELNGTPFIPAANSSLSPSDLESEIALYNARVSQYQTTLNASKNAVEQKKAQLSVENANLVKYEGMLQIAEDKETRLQNLVDQNAIAVFQLLGQQSETINLRETTEAQRKAVIKAQEELNEAENKLESVTANYQKDINEHLVESRKQLYSYVEELKKATENQRLSVITAPATGRVYNLSVHTVGGIVTDAQPLMMVVPDGVGIELEVWADNKDVGFIKVGQTAEVKIMSFNFQKYGVLEAVVEDVGADAYDDSRDLEKNKKYRLLLKLKQDVFDVAGEEVSVTPGMEATAEIKIKEKRIIEFFLDPFRRYTNEALRER